jgi:hypothetical protein
MLGGRVNEGLLGPRPNHKLEDYPLSAVRDGFLTSSQLLSKFGGRLHRSQPEARIVKFLALFYEPTILTLCDLMIQRNKM